MGPAFDRRCIPSGGVAPPSNTPGILSRRALPDGRLTGLGASPPLMRWVLGSADGAAGQLRLEPADVQVFVGVARRLIQYAQRFHGDAIERRIAGRLLRNALDVALRK